MGQNSEWMTLFFVAFCFGLFENGSICSKLEIYALICKFTSDFIPLRVL